APCTAAGKRHRPPSTIPLEREQNRIGAAFLLRLSAGKYNRPDLRIECAVEIVQRRQVVPLLQVRIGIGRQFHQLMRTSVIGDQSLESSNNRSPITRRQLHWKDVSEQAVLVAAAGKGISAAHHHKAAAAIADEVDDILELVLIKEGRFNAAEDQTF